MFVPDVTFEKIPIKNLVSNQDYQRNLSQKHIQKAAENFDLYQINPVKVSRRDGINYVFNGQHTIEIVALISGSRDTPVWCMVYDDLNYQHEADSIELPTLEDDEMSRAWDIRFLDENDNEIKSIERGYWPIDKLEKIVSIIDEFLNNDVATEWLHNIIEA